VHVSELDLTGAGSTAAISISGTGQTNIYHVTSDAIGSLTNNTSGSIVSGTMGGANLISVKGSIGPTSGSTGAWLFGFEDAPVSGDTDQEPQYGWFHGTINGLNVSGDLGKLDVNGSLGDLRVTGNAGKVVVNKDKFTASGRWDGVEGLVWAGGSIGSIDVGDGLADDGAGDMARAGIMSTGYIGTVLISGPRRTVNNRVFANSTARSWHTEILFRQGSSMPLGAS